jgi:seryl-tRNA synthetase
MPVSDEEHRLLIDRMKELWSNKVGSMYDEQKELQSNIEELLASNEELTRRLKDSRKKESELITEKNELKYLLVETQNKQYEMRRYIAQLEDKIRLLSPLPPDLTEFTEDPTPSPSS